MNPPWLWPEPWFILSAVATAVLLVALCAVVATLIANRMMRDH